MTDLNTITPYHQRRAFNKSVTGPTIGNEVNLLNVASGSGIVNHIWLADRPGASGYPQFDHSIRIYTNGNPVPDVDMDLGTFFGFGGGEAYSAGNIHTEHWSARAAGAGNIDRYGGSISIPIPFTNGIRITTACTTPMATSYVFSQVDYVLATDNPGIVIPPYTLKVVGNKWLYTDRLSVAATADITLATIPAGNPGFIIGHSMVAGEASNHTYLERYVATYIDGEASPSIKSSGTEDWFDGSDYFYTGQTPYSSHGAMGLGSSTNAWRFSALADFLAMNGGYKFESSALVKWLTHPAVSTNVNYGNALFYYRHT